MANFTWQDIARNVREYRDASIARIEPPIPEVPNQIPQNVTHLPKELLSKEEFAIVSWSSDFLLSQLAKGRISSVEVTKAYLRSAGLAQKLVGRQTLVMRFVAMLIWLERPTA